MNILFICSRNQWRSPTAEAIYKNKDGVNAKSAGTEPAARVRVNEQMLHWADIVFVMEHKHKKRLQQLFRTVLDTKKVVVLDIPDEYRYMDEELQEIIRSSVDEYLS